MPRTKTRGNGTGTAYRQGSGWMAAVVLGYDVVTRPDGSIVSRPVRVRRGGYRTKKEALEACAELKRSGGRRESIPQTWTQIYDAWEAAYSEKITRSTLNCYRSAKKYFAPLRFDVFSQIGIDDLQECLDDCPHGKRTRQNMKALASLLYKYAIPRHQADRNYAEFLNVPSGDSVPRPAFTSAQVKKIAAAVDSVPHADLIYALILTGFRPAELFALTSESYRADPVPCLIGGAKTAAGRDRAVTLSPWLLPLILRRVSASTPESPWLFPRDDGHQLDPAYFRTEYFYPCLEALGIQPVPAPGSSPELTPYSCRHTFSNLLRDASGSGKDKAALIGHEKYTTTERLYQSADLENMQRITDQF